MEPKQFSREPLKDALARLKAVDLPSEVTEGTVKMLEDFLKLPDLPPRPFGQHPKYAMEMSFYEFAHLPVSPEDPRPLYEYLMEGIQKALGDVEWAAFAVRNKLNQ